MRRDRSTSRHVRSIESCVTAPLAIASVYCGSVSASPLLSRCPFKRRISREKSQEAEAKAWILKITLTNDVEELKVPV